MCINTVHIFLIFSTTIYSDPNLLSAAARILYFYSGAFSSAKMKDIQNNKTETKKNLVYEGIETPESSVIKDRNVLATKHKLFPNQRFFFGFLIKLK